MEKMDTLKLRLLLGGCIVTAIGVVLIILRGFSIFFMVLPIIGIVALVIGILKKPREKKKTEN
jgi:membrane-bound ClpP family serine protease